jgi:hypothetical protein
MGETTDGSAGTAGGRHPTLEHLEALVGEWETEATHPELPGTTIPGRATFMWLEGGRFLIWRAHHDHPDIPDSIAILGRDDAGDADSAAASGGVCSCHYFDSRGVSRVWRIEAEAGVWRMWRDWPGFSQRFTGTFGDSGDTIAGSGELSTDDATWKPDLQVNYRRVT